MRTIDPTATATASRSPHGERGLKFGRVEQLGHDGPGRSPHGERGLKSAVREDEVSFRRVALLTESVD